MLGSSLSNDAVTFMLIGCECLHYFEALASHVPPPADRRLDKVALLTSLKSRS
jgi:hypothetical protein